MQAATVGDHKSFAVFGRAGLARENCSQQWYLRASRSCTVGGGVGLDMGGIMCDVGANVHIVCQSGAFSTYP